MRSIVIDIDGTICNAENRDYPNAVSIKPVIEKINFLYNKGYRIILYSSRGMNSFKGDLNLILKNTKPVLEQWLKNNNVMFHELIFGKPLADWYVDDKALSVEDFISMPFYDLRGGSGESIRREGNKVLKTGKSSKMQYDWYKVLNSYPNSSVHIPKVYGITLETLYMQYIHGDSANLNPSRFTEIVGFIEEISKIEFSANCNIKKYCENVLSHIDEEWTREVCNKIMEMEKVFHSHLSFCHGDTTLSNCILTKENFFMIDPAYKSDYNSYLVDFSKLRMSLNGFEENLNLHRSDMNKEYVTALEKFDKYLYEKGILDLVKLLEIANWIRLHNFRKGEEQRFAYSKAKSLWENYEK